MVGTGVIDTVAKISETLIDKNGWNWCYRHCDENGWSSLQQKWVELSMKKMDGTHCGKNDGTGVIDTVTKMGKAHCGKNGWSPP